LTSLIEDESDTSIPALVWRSLKHLVVQLREISSKLEEIEVDLAGVATSVDACRRLMTIPGVGIITATSGRIDDCERTLCRSPLKEVLA
jgi:transposase